MSIVALPAFTDADRFGTCIVPSAASMEPALADRSSWTEPSVGSVTCQRDLWPKSMPEWCGDWTCRSPSEVIVGGVPSSDVPATVHALPVAEVIVASPQLRSSLTVADACSGPGLGRERLPGVVAADPARPEPGPRHEPDGEPAADEDAERRGDDEAADDRRPRPLEDQPEADADEDQRPQLPDLPDPRRVEDARLDQQGDRPGHDEEDAPAEQSAIDSHAHTSRPPRAGLEDMIARGRGAREGHLSRRGGRRGR